MNHLLILTPFQQHFGQVSGIFQSTYLIHPQLIIQFNIVYVTRYRCKCIINTFRQRLLDICNCVQEWNNNVVSKDVVTLYKELKLSIEFEPYLDKLFSINSIICITKLRLCAHNLRIHTGRYEHLDNNVRYCQVCKIHEIEDDFHFVLNFPLYTNLLKHYIKQFYTNRPSMYNLTELLNNQKKSELCMLSKHVTEAVKLRNSIIYWYNHVVLI